MVTLPSDDILAKFTHDFSEQIMVEPLRHHGRSDGPAKNPADQ
jgi:hypothetical protein